MTNVSDVESTDSVMSEYSGVRRASNSMRDSGMGMDSSYQGVGSSYNNYTQEPSRNDQASRRQSHTLALRKREDEARKKADAHLRDMKYQKERGLLNEPDTGDLLKRSGITVRA